MSLMGKEQGKRRNLGEFPLPPSSKELPTETGEEEEEDDLLQEEPTEITVQEFPEIIITDEDREKFLMSILFETHYTETVELFGGRLKVTLRTRDADEAETVMKYIRDSLPEAIIDVEVASSKGNLAFALTKLESQTPQGVHTEDLTEIQKFQDKLKRVNKFPLPKFTLLIELLARFDNKVFRLRDEAIKPDFSLTGDAP